MKLEHFHSDINGSKVEGKRMETPSVETIKEVKTLGRVAVGEAEVIYRNEGKSGEYIVVIRDLWNGIAGNRYRDMYRLT